MEGTDEAMRPIRWRSKVDSNRRSLSRECRLIFAEKRAFRSIRVVKTGHPFSRGTSGSNPCTLQSGYWLVGIVDWPNRASLPGVACESCVLST